MMAANQGPVDTEVNLNVGGQPVKGAESSHSVDIIDRDPTNMNTYLKVSFEDIFAEPHSSIYSFDGVWTTSYKVFRNTKMWCYRITTLLCAVPASIFWGIYFAILACCTIWCCRPCIRAYEIEMHCLKGFYTAALNAFIRPCYEAMGFCFYNIRIALVKGGDPTH